MTSSRTKLLLVGVGLMGQPYLAAARRLGLQVRAVEGAARAAGIADRLDGLHVARGELDELWAEGAWAAAVADRPDGVLAFTEWNVLGAALLQDRLGLPGPSLHAAVVSRNKALQRGLFASAGVRQPDYVVVDGLAAAADWVAGRLPVVVKPLSSAGSAGVELVATRAAFTEVAARRAGERSLLVETAVQGPEYSWEALIHDGAVWLSNTTAKETTEAPYFVEVAHRTGAALGAKVAAQVDELGAQVIGALGMRTGVVHLEFRLATDGPTVMEVAVRTPGDHLMELLGLTYGIDWFEALARLTMSLPLPEAPAGPVAFAASYFPSAPTGVVTEVAGLDAVLAHPAVVRAELTKQPGEVVAPTALGADRVGYVLLAADRPEKIEEALTFVRRSLVVRTAAA